MAGVLEIAAISDVKQYLQIPAATTNYDWALQTILMPAATRVIEREVGHIIATQITAERHSGGNIEIWLRELPVLYVQNIEEGWGYFNEELAFQPVNTQPALDLWAYSLDNAMEGRVTRRAPGNVAYPFVQGLNNIRVDYIAGREQVPDNARLAFHQLVSYWFREGQERTLTGAPNPYDTLNADFTRSQGETSINMGVPESIIEALKPDRRRPIIG